VSATLSPGDVSALLAAQKRDASQPRAARQARNSQWHSLSPSRAQALLRQHFRSPSKNSTNSVAFTHYSQPLKLSLRNELICRDFQWSQPGSNRRPPACKFGPRCRRHSSSVVIAADSGDGDPHLAPYFAVVCGKCFVPACSLGSAEPLSSHALPNPYRSRKPLRAFSPLGVRVPPSPSFIVDSQHRPGIRLSSSRCTDLATQVNAGRRRPHWPVRHSPQGRTADLTGAVLNDRAETSCALRVGALGRVCGDSEGSR
jgi:hypothetical protein